MTEAPHFYSYFAGYGRAILAEALGDNAPFILPQGEIVARVLAAGYTADLKNGRRDPFPVAGSIGSVHREGQHFLVAVDAEGETIIVQEVRADAYGPE